MAATPVNLCDCPNDCNSNFYAYSMSAMKLDTDAMCHAERLVLTNTSFSGDPNLMRNFEALVLGLKVGQAEICARTLSRLALIEFQLTGDNIVQFKRELRVTLADQIASLGKP